MVYGLIKRKKRRSIGGLTMMDLFVPSLAIVSRGTSQLVPAAFVFCCRFQPVEGDGQRTTTVLVGVPKISSEGTTNGSGGET